MPAVALARAAPRTTSRRRTSAPSQPAFLKGEPVEGEVAVITREQAAEADYNLSPSRWVGQAAGDDEADLQDIIERFEAIVAEEATVSANLQAVLTRLKGLT